MKLGVSKRISESQLQLEHRSFYQSLNFTELKRQIKLKYDLLPLIKQFQPLLKILTFFLSLIRFPLLYSPANPQTIHKLDKQIKNQYQQLIKQCKLTQEFHFELFIIITIKITKKFVQSLYQQIEITHENQGEIYCVIIKLLLGINVHMKAFDVIEKKFIDKEKYQLSPIIIPQKQRFNTEISSKCMKSDSKNPISLNYIQAKLQRRKMNRRRFEERPSMDNNWRQNTEIEQLRQNLAKQLSVIKESSQKIKRIKYGSLQKKEMFDLGERQCCSKIKQTFGKSIIQSEQISSSLELNMLINRSRHSYSKNNVTLKLTDPTPRLSHRVFEHSPTVIDESPRRSINVHNTEKVHLSKKTKTYWFKMANKMREVYNNFQH